MTLQQFRVIRASGSLPILALFLVAGAVAGELCGVSGGFVLGALAGLVLWVFMNLAIDALKDRP